MATLFRNPYLAEGLENLLYKQDGSVLGICNGFQALIKLGLLPGWSYRNVDCRSSYIDVQTQLVVTYLAWLILR